MTNLSEIKAQRLGRILLILPIHSDKPICMLVPDISNCDLPTTLNETLTMHSLAR
jgi:hypothetical protein